MQQGKVRWAIILLEVAIFVSPRLFAQASGNSTSVSGTVTDPSSEVISGATVEIQDPVSGYNRTTRTDSAGNFSFPNVPFNPYHMTVVAPGFTSFVQDVEVRSTVPVTVKIRLKLAGATTQVSVETSAGDLLETDSTYHTDLDRGLIEELPLESQSSSLSSLVTLSTPGIAADSNGLFHGMGDHAENSFTVDNQPITDQQSKIFSNQIPLDAVQSMEVIPGAPPAEFGDKTSVVIVATTRSGLGVTPPSGSVTTSFGTFGTPTLDFNLAMGGPKWGNFVAASGLESNRFLDPPEFEVMHDRGNEENVFDRIDFKATTADTLQLNLEYTHSWFQNPNTYDNLNIGVTDPDGAPVGPTDQRSSIGTFNIAPTWTHLFGTTMVFTLSGFVRQDHYNYDPSANPFSDFGPLQSESIGQNRTLKNTGFRAEFSYVKGKNNVKGGMVYQQTFLTESDRLGIVAPISLVDPTGSIAACYDLAVPLTAAEATTDGCPNPSGYNGTYQHVPEYLFHGHTDVKELALYLEDTITAGNWSINLGVRGDAYNGLVVKDLPEPRVGVAYKVAKTSTVLRLSYARTMETPFNENLVLASSGCSDPVISFLVPCVPAPLTPGTRNEFHAGLQQAFGRYFVLDGEYVWKYTHDGFDFSILGNTPITFPVEWTKSKIPGFTLRGTVPNVHGFSAFVVMSHVAARFFPPQIGGLGVTVGQSGAVFRIDHDEVFNQTTHLQYQPWKSGPWFGFNWRYDSGLVAGNAPCYGVAAGNDCPQSTTLGGQPAIIMETATGVPLSADQEFEAGFTCNGAKASPPSAAHPTGVPLPSTCLASEFGSTLISVPAPGKENDDHNPPRIAPRSLFDMAVGDDNLFHSDHNRWSLQFTMVNLMNKVALYNFLSTFSGTHYVTPRTETLELGFHF
jgi:hypothetical protein